MISLEIKINAISLSNLDKKVLKCLLPNRKDYSIDDIKEKIKNTKDLEIKKILKNLVYLKLAWRPENNLDTHRIADLGKDLLNKNKTTPNGEFLIGMELLFGDIKVRILDMSRQKYADLYKFEFSYKGLKNIDRVHTESRTKQELIQNIKKKLQGKDIF